MDRRTFLKSLAAASAVGLTPLPLLQAALPESTHKDELVAQR